MKSTLLQADKEGMDLYVTSDEENSSNDGDERLSQYMDLFYHRPYRLDEKTAWLLSLEEKYGQIWYKDFFTWYIAQLHHPKTQFEPLDTMQFHDLLREMEWKPTNPYLEIIINRLARIYPNKTPDYYIGRYNDQTIGLILHGSALDPPMVDIEVFDSLGVQYAH